MRGAFSFCHREVSNDPEPVEGRITRSHAVGIEEAVNDFLLYHQRKGDPESYLCELRSYLIGGSGHYGKRRVWLPLMPWVGEARLAHIGDLTKQRIGAHLDHVRL